MPFKILPWDHDKGFIAAATQKSFVWNFVLDMFEAALLSTLKEMNCCLMINRCENCSTSSSSFFNFNSSLWIPCELEFRHCTAIADPFKKHLYILCWTFVMLCMKCAVSCSTIHSSPVNSRSSLKRLKNPTDFLVIRNDKFEVPRPTHCPKLPRLTPSKKLVVSLSWNCFLSSKSFFDLH